MFGNNPKRSIVKDNNGILSIHKIFATFQGEGPFIGTPSVFIRLSGCNLNCSFCDTDFEDFNEYSIDELINQIKHLQQEFKFLSNKDILIVITGGEPLRQNIEELCVTLLALNYPVQIETNGTIYRNLPDDVYIVCSPKNNGYGYKPLHPELAERINCFKFIISHDNPLYNHVPDFIREYNKLVYLQPMDQFDVDKNNNNKALTINLAKEYGYKISIQMHKIFAIE